MYAIIIALIVFACVAGGALIGSLLSAVLPPQHLSNKAKDTVKVGMGLIGTMTAILLGLLIASAKSFFDTQNTELTEMSSKVILLDPGAQSRDRRRENTLAHVTTGYQLRFPAAVSGSGFLARSYFL